MSGVGGVVRLTCGGIGTGKSYLNVKNACEEIKKGKYKKIYSNIRGHAELSDGEILPMPDDWRDCESDSLIIFDEIQMHEKFSKHFSSRRDGEIASISMIRHQRIDLWLISPNPALVNSDIRNLVNQYYWLEIQSKTVTKAWCFTKVYNNVTKTIKNQAYDEFTYTIEEKYYKLYMSTEDGQASGRNAIINFKLISFIVGLVFVVCIIIALMFFLTNSTKKGIEELDKKTQSTEQQEKQDKSIIEIDKSSIENIPHDKLNEYCAKIEYVNNPQCIEYTRVNANNFYSSDNQIAYDVSKPYEPIEYRYEIQQKPYLVGCMADKYRCNCYTQQGTLITIEKQDCKRYINGDKPFNAVRPVENYSTMQNMAINAKDERISDNKQQTDNQEMGKMIILPDTDKINE